MLRSVLLVCLRQPVTCIVRSEISSYKGGHQYLASVQHSSRFHTDQTSCVMDKDDPGRKVVRQALKESRKIPQESEDDIEIQEFRPGTVFPTKETPEMLIGGVRFDQLPIVHVKATHNNTLLTVTNYKGKQITGETAGSVGFRNKKKGTNVAAQTAAVSAGEKAVGKGVKSVRVILKGVGPGRLPALKGLQMAGLMIVSITDETILPFNGNRPPKPRVM